MVECDTAAGLPCAPPGGPDSSVATFTAYMHTIVGAAASLPRLRDLARHGHATRRCAADPLDEKC
jgi:hypothetical protein